MTPAQFIAGAGGALVASFEFGDRAADRNLRRKRSCTGCGSLDHDRKRCNGVGLAPREKDARHKEPR